MERKGVDAGPIDEKAQAFLSRHVGRISFHAAPWLEDISSSWLREHKPWNNPDLDVVEKEKLIHPKVVDYILTHHLYD